MTTGNILLTLPELRSVIWHLEAAARTGISQETKQGLKKLRRHLADREQPTTNENITIENRSTDQRPTRHN